MPAEVMRGKTEILNINRQALNGQGALLVRHWIQSTPLIEPRVSAKFEISPKYC